ncbi:MAG: glycosyltransferase family 4 protein [Candidatus Omnitrophica bacterium]|jgi:glycosyltransferase involved in cell wall biosynthesis|nr:glycosyltransferase family 4 protein [Candidatus Omnitrophota bacterium]MDD5665320.1 glycosyltransferase family 4 protein [Candidatus Omnitrophota bacterium]
MKKTKIIHVITRMDWGGSPDIVRQIFTSLSQESFDIYLIFGLTKNSTRQTKDFLRELKDKSIYLPSLRREINPLMDLMAFFELCRIFYRLKPDIITTHTAKAGALGRLAAFCLGLKKVIHFPHGNIFYGYFNKIISLFILKAEQLLAIITSRIIVFTESEKAILLKLGLAKEEKIMIIPAGIDPLPYPDKEWLKKERLSLGIQEEDFVVGMVSRLEPVKGADYFILAALQVLEKRNDVCFLVVGEGSLRAKLELWVANHKKRDKIIFTGWREDAGSLMGLMDILVQPSLNEAIGRVLLQAQGLGIAVIATQAGGIPDIVCNGVTGILIPPAETAKLTEAIVSLLSDTAKREAFAKKGGELVKDRFSMEVMAKGIRQLYKEEVYK